MLHSDNPFVTPSEGAPTGTRQPLREKLCTALPLRSDALVLRPWLRNDADLVAHWQGYPSPYACYNVRHWGESAEERDRLYAEREGNPNRLGLIVDWGDQPCAGYVLLCNIDWTKGTVERVSIRIHPLFCDRGIGTTVMRMCAQWAFSGGLQRLRLDVAAGNPRAIRCYEKIGYSIVGEFWREEDWLAQVDLSEPAWANVRPHVDFTGDSPRQRFLLMDLTPETFRAE